MRMPSSNEWMAADWSLVSRLEDRATTLRTPADLERAIGLVAPRVPFRHPSCWPLLLLLTVARVCDYRPHRAKLAQDLHRRGYRPTDLLQFLLWHTHLGRSPSWIAAGLRQPDAIDTHYSERRNARDHRLDGVTCGYDNASMAAEVGAVLASLRPRPVPARQVMRHLPGAPFYRLEAM